MDFEGYEKIHRTIEIGRTSYDLIFNYNYTWNGKDIGTFEGCIRSIGLWDVHPSKARDIVSNLQLLRHELEQIIRGYAIEQLLYREHQKTV